ACRILEPIFYHAGDVFIMIVNTIPFDSSKTAAMTFLAEILPRSTSGIGTITDWPISTHFFNFSRKRSLTDSILVSQTDSNCSYKADENLYTVAECLRTIMQDEQ